MGYYYLGDNFLCINILFLKSNVQKKHSKCTSGSMTDYFKFGYSIPEGACRSSKVYADMGF